MISSFQSSHAVFKLHIFIFMILCRHPPTVGQILVHAQDPRILGSQDLAILGYYKPEMHRLKDPRILPSQEIIILRYTGYKDPRILICTKKRETLQNCTRLLLINYSLVKWPNVDFYKITF